MAFALVLDQLSIMQVFAGLPVVAPRFAGTKPPAKVGGERIDITAQSVSRYCGHTRRIEAFLEIMDKGKGIVPGATAQMKRRYGFADRIEDQPKPGSRCSRTNAGIQLTSICTSVNARFRKRKLCQPWLCLPMRSSQRARVASA